MRVSVFSDTYLPQVNGVSKTVNKLKEYMNMREIECQLFVPGETGQNDNYIHHINGLKLFFYPELKLALPRYLEVSRRLDCFKPDLIHLVTEFSIGMVGLKYARRNSIPIVSSYHTNFAQYLKYYNLNLLENSCWEYLRWFHSHCEKTFCPSIYTRDILKSQGFENLELWSRGIDTQIYSPQLKTDSIRRAYAENDEALLLYVGRLAPEKDLHVLIDAVRILNSREIEYKLLLVGDGPSRELMERENLSNIIFMGYKEGKELSTIYASADIFVFPSSTETYGNVILEAMASGLAVVGVDEGGVRENLRDGYNGLSFSAGDSQGMAERIERLICSSSLRNVLAQNALNHARSRDWDEVFNTLFVNYAKVVDKYGQGQRIPA